MKLKSRTALMISGAVAVHVRPLLAQDAKVDLTTVFSDLTAKSIAMDGAPAKVAAQIVDLVTPCLAQDAEIDADAVEAVVASIQPMAADEDMIDEEKKPAKKAPKKPQAKCAEDGDDDADDTPAMDENAIKALVEAAEKRGAERIAAIDVAKRDVKPFVGEVVGMDSAAAIYRLALDAAKIDLTDVPESAFKAMVSMLPKPSEIPAVAQDAKAVTTHRSDFSKRFPNAAPLVRS